MAWYVNREELVLQVADHPGFEKTEAGPFDTKEEAEAKLAELSQTRHDKQTTTSPRGNS